MKTIFQLHKDHESKMETNFTNLDIAKKIGISERAYCSYRMGKCSPGSHRIELKTRNKIASFFGVSAENIKWPGQELLR